MPMYGLPTPEDHGIDVGELTLGQKVRLTLGEITIGNHDGDQAPRLAQFYDKFAATHLIGASDEIEQ